MKSAGTDKPRREGKAKEFSLVFYPGCTFETSRPMVLLVCGGERFHPREEAEEEKPLAVSKQESVSGGL